MGETNDFFKEAQDLMESGDLPERVSMKLIWAAVSATYARLDKVAELAEQHDMKINRLDWAARIIVGSILAIAAKMIFG